MESKGQPRRERRVAYIALFFFILGCVLMVLTYLTVAEVFGSLQSPGTWAGIGSLQLALYALTAAGSMSFLVAFALTVLWARLRDKRERMAFGE